MARHLAILDDALVRVATGRCKRLIVEMPPRSGKEIAHFTKVPTPHGFKNHGDLKPGDYVYHPTGRPIRVVALSEDSLSTKRVTFSDGAQITCHANHEWRVFDRAVGRWRILETNRIQSRTLRSGPAGRGGRYVLQVEKCSNDAVKRRRTITAVEDVDPTPGRCIQVEADDGMYLVGEHFTPTHNSELCSKYFPVWYLGTFPTRRMIICSATEDLALDFSEQARDIVQEHGQQLFNIHLRTDAKSKALWKLQEGGSLRAAGVGGSIMGRGGNCLLIDDFFKNVEDALSEGNREKLWQWYLSTFKTRLTGDGAIIIIATRWHTHDLTGKVLEMASRLDTDDSEREWEVISFRGLAEPNDPMGRDVDTALWPESKFNTQWMKATRKEYQASGQQWMWDALYQQRPPTVLDAEFSPEYFTEEDYFDEWPEREKIRFRITALDPSLGKSDRSDFSAFIDAALTFDGIMYIDADLERRDSTKICRDGLRLIRETRSEALFVETVGFQEVMQTEFERVLREAGLIVPVYGLNNRTNKRTRIRGTLTPFLARHRFRWRRHSPGVSLLLDQLKGFPSVKYDDGPDALEMVVRGFQYAVDYGLDSASVIDNIVATR